MNTTVLRARVGSLLSSGPMASSPEAVIGHFGCVQAQDFAMAKWAVARRVDGLTDAAMDKAFDSAGFLRTHILRPTWHFVLPADLGWVMALTAPRIRRLMAGMDKQLDLTEAQYDRAAAVIVAALEPGLPLTRNHLAEHLAAAGINASGTRLAHLVIHCELNALICNGPRTGKQHTYRLLPHSPGIVETLSEDEALARLARRYVRGHGPAQPRDLSWWGSLTLTQSRRAFAGLEPCLLGGEEFWVAGEPLDAAPPAAALMPPFDESISYAEKPIDRRRFPVAAPDLARGGGLLFLDGLIGGSWRRTTTATTVTVTVTAAGRLTNRHRLAIGLEAERYAAFLGTSLDLRVGD